MHTSINNELLLDTIKFYFCILLVCFARYYNASGGKAYHIDDAVKITERERKRDNFKVCREGVKRNHIIVTTFTGKFLAGLCSKFLQGKEKEGWLKKF